MTRPPSPPGGGRAYAREIERRWSTLHGRAVVLSPKDWALITDWHARGVPLALIEEAMQSAAERRREAPRNLSYLVPAVDEAWELLLEGRRRDGPVTLPHPPEKPHLRWRQVASERSGAPLGRFLDGLLSRLEAGEPGESVDARLDRELAGLVDARLRSEVEHEVERELEPFHERMGGATLAETLRAAVAYRLRRKLGLPRLAGG